LYAIIQKAYAKRKIKTVKYYTKALQRVNQSMRHLFLSKIIMCL